MSADQLLEYEVEIPACAFAQECGWLHRKMQWIGRRGAPDDFFARDGKVMLVEFKRPGRDLDPHQQLEVNRLRAVGVTVHVVDRFDETTKALFR
jgi:hypothetical protein